MKWKTISSPPRCLKLMPPRNTKTKTGRCSSHPSRQFLDTLIQERIFVQPADFATWKSLSPNSAAAHLLWERSTERIKLSDFAEEFFRRLADATAPPMLLRKGELHQLVAYVDPQDIAPEVSEKLGLAPDSLCVRPARRILMQGTAHHIYMLPSPESVNPPFPLWLAGRYRPGEAGKARPDAAICSL